MHVFADLDPELLCLSLAMTGSHRFALVSKAFACSRWTPEQVSEFLLAKSGGCGGRALVAAAEHGLGLPVVAILLTRRPSEEHLFAALNACGDVDFRTPARIGLALTNKFFQTDAKEFLFTEASAAAFRRDKASWVEEKRAVIVDAIVHDHYWAADDAFKGIAWRLNAIRRASSLIVEGSPASIDMILEFVVRSEGTVLLGTAPVGGKTHAEWTSLIEAAVSALAPAIDRLSKGGDADVVMSHAPVLYGDPARVHPSFSRLLADLSSWRVCTSARRWIDDLTAVDRPLHVAAIVREVVARGPGSAEWAILPSALADCARRNRMQAMRAVCAAVEDAIRKERAAKVRRYRRVWIARTLATADMVTTDARIDGLARIVAHGGRYRRAAFEAVMAVMAVYTEEDRDRFTAEVRGQAP